MNYVNQVEGWLVLNNQACSIDNVLGTAASTSSRYSLPCQDANIIENHSSTREGDSFVLHQQFYFFIFCVGAAKRVAKISKKKKSGVDCT